MTARTPALCKPCNMISQIPSYFYPLPLSSSHPLLISFHLKLLLRPHIYNLQRRIPELNHMSRLQRLSVDILHVMGVENTRTTAVENGLFTGGICEAETTPATSTSAPTRGGERKTYLGSLLGAQTIAILSGIIT